MKGRLAATLLLVLAALTLTIFTPLVLPGREDVSAQQSTSRFERLVLTAEGEPGAAAGSATSGTRLQGDIRAVYIDYGGSVTSTTDITLSLSSPAGVVLGLTNNTTDGWYYPSVQFTSPTGTLVSSAFKSFPINDYLVVDTTESTTETTVTVTVFYGE